MKRIGLALVMAVGCSRPETSQQASPGGAASGGSGAAAPAQQRMIQNKGSDTMVNLAQAWAEEYRKVKPDVAVAVNGGGSGTGIAALINGTVDVANASRAMEPAEIEQAKKNTGKEPVQHVVGLDAIAVIVNPANPLKEISKTKLACLYSAEGKCAKWTDVGATVPGCEGQQVVLVNRQNSSGTYHYFREVVLSKKDFRMGTRDMSGTKDVVDLVSTTPCAIGYIGLGYLTHEVKALCLSPEEGKPCVAPSKEHAVDGTYPLARELFMYTLGQPSGATADYLAWIKSDAGQNVVDQSGYVRVPKK